MKKHTVWFVFFLIIMLWGCRPAGDDIRWLDFEDLTHSLGNEARLSVAFDIDDTLLFSSPGYYYGNVKYSPGSDDYQYDPAFWMEMNNGLDRFSLPKDIGFRLLRFHRERGDDIHFITGRMPSEYETVTALLARVFDLTDPNPVIFAGFRPGENLKIAPLRRHKIDIFYGDADSDIAAAQAAGCRGIRILRAPNSTNKPIPVPGCLGEEVLRDSAY